jgi:aminomethyltransferase
MVSSTANIPSSWAGKISVAEFLIEGEHALELIQKVSSNDASKLTVGKAQYSYLPNDSGGVVDDLIIYKVKEET